MHLVDTLFSYNKTKLISRSDIISELHKRTLYLNTPTQTAVFVLYSWAVSYPMNNCTVELRLPYKRDIQKIVYEQYIYNLSTYRIDF